MSSLYSDLQLGERKIRVLYVQPASNLDDPIRCILRLVNLDSIESKFDALSYVWGDPQVTRTIWVNQQPCEVTSNLFKALKYLRRKRYHAKWPAELKSQPSSAVLGQWIWIDAICINQNNIAERNAQVPLMRDIYSKASTVHVWLGIFDSSMVLGLITLSRMRDLLLQARGDEKGEWDLVYPLQLDAVVANWLNDPVESVGRSILSILNHAWWRRVWVLQEAVLARRVFLHWHDRESNFWDIMDASQALKTALNRASDRKVGHRRSAFMLDLIITLEGTVSKFHEVVLFRRNPKSDETMRICRLLHTASISEASDPRDRVYGILGLLPTKLDVQSRYDLDPEQALADAFFQLICKTRKLIPMLLTTTHIATKSYSWVPDFSAVLTEPILQATGSAIQWSEYSFLNSVYQAAGPTRSCSLDVSSSSSDLTIRGRLVDTVSAR